MVHRYTTDALYRDREEPKDKVLNAVTTEKEIKIAMIVLMERTVIKEESVS